MDTVHFSEVMGQPLKFMRKAIVIRGRLSVQGASGGLSCYLVDDLHVPNRSARITIVDRSFASRLYPGIPRRVGTRIYTDYPAVIGGTLVPPVDDLSIAALDSISFVTVLDMSASPQVAYTKRFDGKAVLPAANYNVEQCLQNSNWGDKTVLVCGTVVAAKTGCVLAAECGQAPSSRHVVMPNIYDDIRHYTPADNQANWPIIEVAGVVEGKIRRSKAGGSRFEHIDVITFDSGFAAIRLEYKGGSQGELGTSSPL
jgi:hypothetical protein